MGIFETYSLYELFAYFIIYSFIGWIMESTFKSLLFNKVINSGFLNGPFIPIYGVGAITVIYFFTPFSNNTLLLFGLGFFYMTLIEFIVGYLMEKIFNTSWWDYTGNFMNIGGKICLENSIYWGLLSVFLLRVMHPFFGQMIASIPKFIGEKVLIGFVIYFIIDYTFTLIEVLNMQEQVKMFVEAKNNIVSVTASKMEALKKYIVKRSRRLVTTYPRLTYIKLNKKLKDIISEIRK